MAAATLAAYISTDNTGNGSVLPALTVTLPVLHTDNLTSDPDLRANFTHQGRDPHQLPNFSPSTSPSSPILYLPPILSALPRELSHATSALPDGQTPLTTSSHLPSIDDASLALHRALHRFHPITSEYASIPYAAAFNWDELELPEDEEREWYCVVFRSRRKEGSNSGRKCLYLLLIVAKKCDPIRANRSQLCTRRTEKRTRRQFRMEE